MRSCCNSFSNISNIRTTSFSNSQFSSSSSPSTSYNSCFKKKDNCNIDCVSFGYMGINQDLPANQVQNSITIGTSDESYYTISTFDDFIAQWGILAAPNDHLIVARPGKYVISANISLIPSNTNVGRNYVAGFSISTGSLQTGVILLQVYGNSTDTTTTNNPSYTFSGQKIVNLISTSDNDIDFPVSLYLNLIVLGQPTITYNANWASLTITPI